MRRIEIGASLLLFAFLAACSSTAPKVAVAPPAADGTITIKGRYGGDDEDDTKRLVIAMSLQADQNCPSGWSRISDMPNRETSYGGRVWRVACAAPPAGAAGSGYDSAGNAPAGTMGGGSSTLSRAELMQLLMVAARQSGPELSNEAAAAVVDAEMRELAAARIEVLGPDGRPVPLAP